MQVRERLTSLFTSERQKMIAELRYLFTIETTVVEDLVGDTFLSAIELWETDGLPAKPAAWLHTVARNKAKNYLKKKAIFDKKLSPELKSMPVTEDGEVEFPQKTIDDSQLAMIFAICNPCLPDQAQAGLALNLLCGFGIQEIADAFLTTKHVIYKRLERAKERIRISNVNIAQPTLSEVNDRLENVLTILYLVFSEGYFSNTDKSTLRKSFCSEAMRLNSLLIKNPVTNTPAANALFALMCFHASRFAARISQEGTIVSYEDQDEVLWDKELIAKGLNHLNIAAHGEEISRFHLEAGIAYWHTRKGDTLNKWEHILSLYNKLLELEYSPLAALNRTYALAKVKGIAHAMAEAKRLQLTDNVFYRSLINFLCQERAGENVLHRSFRVTTVADLN